jgi:phosphatidylserine/phosphatidylglycerophosphate/cardiolipin synthase-like enzyme
VDDIVETIISTPFKKLRGYNYFIIPTPRYKNFLIQSLEEGKQIEIVTNSQTSASSVSDSGYIYALKPMIELSKKGLDIIEWRGKAPHTYLHTKVMIFDEDRAIIGSHNLGVGSTSVSNEIAVEINSPSHVARLIEIFENDKKDTELTNQVDTEFLKKKLQENKFMSFLLNFSPIAKTLSEFY